MSNLFDKFNITKPQDNKPIVAPKKNNKEPYAKIIFRFENNDDLLEFSNLINQKIEIPKDNIWFPERLYNPNKVKVIGEVKTAKSIFDLLK